MAEESGLDLVEVAPESDPPVCRIMDYGKYRYEQTKKEKESKKKQQSIKIKEIKIRPAIDRHDYEIKVNHAIEFLEKGCKVKVTMTFRGREMARIADGREKLLEFSKDIAEYGTVERDAKLLGRNMILIVGPKKQHQPKTLKKKDQESNE